MNRAKVWILGFGIMAALTAGQASAQTAKTGCTRNGAVWVCNRAMFQKAILEAKTVSIDTRSIDKNGRMQLEKLASELGKTVVEGPADLTLALVQLDQVGVNYGPSGKDLGTLSVYASGPEGQHGPLVWSETFTGEPDMRWPAVVHALVRQFREALEKK
jgi:hypothetical protein